MVATSQHTLSSLGLASNSTVEACLQISLMSEHTPHSSTALGASDILCNLLSSDTNEDSNIVCSFEEEVQISNSSLDAFVAVTQSSPLI